MVFSVRLLVYLFAFCFDFRIVSPFCLRTSNLGVQGGRNTLHTKHRAEPEKPNKKVRVSRKIELFSYLCTSSSVEVGPAGPGVSQSDFWDLLLLRPVFLDGKARG